MSNEIENLQSKNEKQLLKTYEHRLRKIKRQIVEALRNGQDTKLLRKIKNRIEVEIDALRDDFKAVTNEIILSSYLFGFQNQKEKLKALGVSPIVVFDVNNQTIKVYHKLINNSFEIVAENMEQTAKAFLKTDFENPQAVLKKIRKIWGVNIPRSKVREKNTKLLAQRIEKDLKKVDLFKIPYHNKDGKVIRHVGVKSYSQMVARTITANTYRDAVKDLVLAQFKNVGDLVEVDGSKIVRCGACNEYYGEILSLKGQTQGYTTLKEAMADGLFHPNCKHSYNITKKVLDIYNNS